MRGWGHIFTLAQPRTQAGITGKDRNLPPEERRFKRDLASAQLKSKQVPDEPTASPTAVSS